MKGARGGRGGDNEKSKVKVRSKSNEGLEKMGIDEKSGVKRKREGEGDEPEPEKEKENDDKRCQTKLMLTKRLKQMQLTTGTLGLTTKPTRPNDSKTTKLNMTPTRITNPTRRLSSASRPRPRTDWSSGAATDGSRRSSPSSPSPSPPSRPLSPRRQHPERAEQVRQLQNWLISGSKLTGGTGLSPGLKAAEQPRTPTSTRPVRTSDPPPSPRTYTLEEDSALDHKHVGAEN